MASSIFLHQIKKAQVWHWQAYHAALKAPNNNRLFILHKLKVNREGPMLICCKVSRAEQRDSLTPLTI